MSACVHVQCVTRISSQQTRRLTAHVYVQVRLWTAAGDQKSEFKTREELFAVALCTDSGMIATVNMSMLLQLWSLAGDFLRSLSRQVRFCSKIAFSSNALLGCTTASHKIKICEATGTPVVKYIMDGELFAWARHLTDFDQLADEVKYGSFRRYNSNQEFVIANIGKKIVVYKLPMDSDSDSAPVVPPVIATFHAHAHVAALCCVGTRICVGLRDGQVSLR